MSWSMLRVRPGVRVSIEWDGELACLQATITSATLSVDGILDTLDDAIVVPSSMLLLLLLLLMLLLLGIEEVRSWNAECDRQPVASTPPPAVEIKKRKRVVSEDKEVKK